MTLSTSTMSLFMSEPILQPVTEVARNPASAASTALESADVEARRLAAAVARGDEVAFQQLYDAYQPRLLRLAVVLARGDELLAGEAVQSTFLTAASKLRPVAGEVHLWNWLARITRQHLAKQWRQRQRDPSSVSLAEIPNGAEMTPPDSLLEESLDTALLALDSEDRRIIEWFYLEGLSQKDIAEKLQTTPKAVSSRLERARARLRLLVAKNLSDET